MRQLGLVGTCARLRTILLVSRDVVGMIRAVEALNNICPSSVGARDTSRSSDNLRLLALGNGVCPGKTEPPD